MQKRSIFKFLNKKGTLITRQMLEHLIKLGFLFFIYYLLQSYVKSIEKDTEFQKIFLSRDIALLVNTLYTAPGEVTYNYHSDKLDLSKFKLELKSLSTTDENPIIRVEGDGIGKNYPYAKTLQNNEGYSITRAKAIKLSKTESKLTVT